MVGQGAQGVPLTKRAAERVLDRGRISDTEAKAAHLLPTQIATPEAFTDREATLIDKNQRLPNGVPLNRTPTWSDSPWSETGSVHHDWELIRKRYADQPEVLKVFKEWAGKTEVSKGVTVTAWIGEGVAAKSKLTLKATRTMKGVTAALDALKPAHEEAVNRIRAAARKCDTSPRGSVEYNKARAEMKRARVTLEAVREQARAAISIPAGERGRLNLTFAGGKPTYLKAGAAAVERFTHPDLLKAVTVNVSAGRACAGYDGSIHVTKGESAASIAHEITHVTEYSDAATLQSARNFLARRIKTGELPVRLDVIYPSRGYFDWEIALEDDFAARGGESYSGKLYFLNVETGAARARWSALLKTNPALAFDQISATEVLTMGMERLVRDPLVFWLEDPDYFDTVVSALQKLTP